MRGKVRFAKYPPGVYYCQIADVTMGLNTKKEEIIIVKYQVVDGDHASETFTERLNSVSSRFLKGIGEPAELNADWDTEKWKGKFLWVTVKYSDDEAQWPRYHHSQEDPRIQSEPPAAVEDNAQRTPVDDIPF